MLMGEEKLSSDKGCHKGTWRVSRPGVVEIFFDNSFSRLRSKQIHYSFEASSFDTASEDDGAEAEGEFKTDGPDV